MIVRLLVTEGPHTGERFEFGQAESFLVGRSEDSHLKFSQDDPFISRRHMLLQCNPPRVRMLDLNSRNGVLVNGIKAVNAELKHGDQLEIGHTKIQVAIEKPMDESSTLQLFQSESASLATLELVRDANRKPKDALHVVSDSGRTLQFEPCQIEGYQVQGEIGRGGMGVVYRATRIKDGTVVAIKQIAQDPTTPPKAMERFIREARIAAAIQHDNIVQLLDAGESASLGYIVMEYVDGLDLKHVVQRGGPVHPKSAIRIVRQLLSGLTEAHRLGFVHRDVKPSNVLLGKACNGKSVAKLGDFGLARAYEASQLSGLTMQGEIGGTPSFMAPEQITHYRDVKPAADQYSVAATLYYLLSGKYPFSEDKSATSLLLRILTEDPVPIRHQMPNIAKDLENVIARAMHRDPNKRFANCEAMRDALRPFAT